VSSVVNLANTSTTLISDVGPGNPQLAGGTINNRGAVE
jgi:hypothetical protein